MVGTAVPPTLAAHGNEIPFIPQTSTPMEDDGAVARAAGHVLDGMENRVVAPGAIIGDGSLFLDVRLRDSVSALFTFATVDVPVGMIVGTQVGRPDLLTTGYQIADAWYGWWYDFDNDGTIDDIHDGACGSSPCGGDEFAWRGLASGESLTVTTSYLPSTSPLIAPEPNYSNHAWSRMNDQTAPRHNPHQTWKSSAHFSYTESFLTTLTVVAFANAREVLNGADGFPLDLKDPNALHDVDVHEALSPEVESLYWSTVRAVNDTVGTLLDPIGFFPSNPYPVRPPPVDAPETPPLPGPSPTAVAAFALGAAVALADGRVPGYPVRPPPVDPVPRPALPGPTPIALVSTIVGTGADTINLLPYRDPASAPDETVELTQRISQPPWPKEPSTWEDDYGSHALFGGVGDALGSYNSYDGYAATPHLWADNLAYLVTCAGVGRNAVGSGITVALTSSCGQYAYEPVGGAVHGTRSSGFALGFEMYVGLWHDLDLDTHVGNICDPYGPAFDAERNTCDREGYSAWGHDWFTSEIIPACVGSSARDGRIILTPLGAPWPSVVVLQSARDWTRIATADSVEVRSDDAPIELRWEEQCAVDSDERDEGTIRARDVVYFLEGPSVPIRVLTEVVSAPYLDASTGILIPSERVVDVDILPAGM